MGLDIRTPIGLLFAVVGAILVLSSFFLSSEVYRASLGININLWWGLVMLAFGLIMVFLGARRNGSPLE
jgi:hypothetical protein